MLVFAACAFAAADTTQVLSPIEQAYQEIGIAPAMELKQYGYDLFGRWVPSAVGPVGGDYILGPGDVLRIYIWGEPVELGALQSTYEIPVAEDGRLFFSPVGRVSVWGTSIDRVKELLTDQLRLRYRNFQLDIVPAEVRQIPVFVSGFVNQPGVVTANSLWSILDVLSAAEGVSKDGSLRTVMIVRPQGTVHVDLYDLFIFGKGDLPKIQEGDVVLVPPIGNVVAGGGEVVRPGIYELAEGETIEDLLRFTGGVRFSGAMERGTLIRRDGTDFSVHEGSVRNREFLTQPVMNGDLLLFALTGSAQANLATVGGHVLYPGVYSITETRMLSSLLRKAQLRPDTDLTFGTLERMLPDEDGNSYLVFNVAQILNQDNEIDIVLAPMDSVTLYRKELSLAQAPVHVFGEIEGGIAAYRPGISLLDVLASRRIESPERYQARIIRSGETVELILLRDLLVRGDKTKNVLLQPGDRVVVVRNDELAYDEGSIKVLGNVAGPGVYTVTTGMKLSDVLEAAGGFTDQAYPSGMVVLRDSVRQKQAEQLSQSAALLERQIGQLIQAMGTDTLSSDVKMVLQAQIIQQQAVLDLAYDRSHEDLGRIALSIGDITSVDEIRGTPNDILLEDGDSVFVPKRPDYVIVMGDMQTGIAIPFEPKKTVREYITEVGGISTSDHRLTVIKASGKMVQGERTLFGGSTIGRELLQPGDIVLAIRELRIPSGITISRGLISLIETANNTASLILNMIEIRDKW